MLSDQRPLPPDQAEREKILRDLDETLLVEAAAGAGKTTSMVGRLVALLAEGKCEARNLAAITFTKKAAAELRDRFQIQLARAAREAEGGHRARLERAAARVDQAFIGTIHSFCGRLLRERPVEAGVDLGFGEMEDDEDRLFRREAWAEHVAGLYAREDPILEDLDRVGLSIGDLEGAFLSYALYPDVDEWPAPEAPVPNLEGPVRELLDYARHMESLADRLPLPENLKTDRLSLEYRNLPRLLAYLDLDEPKSVFRALDRFKKSAKFTQKEWMVDDAFTREAVKEEGERWKTFCEEVADPFRAAWHEYRYPIALRAIEPALEVYDRLREEAGKLNFQDLLLRAAKLLRERPEVRRYFRKRYTRLLVDEFQDTDPIQAEVMLFLTATDPEETDWTRCQPAPGSLFVVGDPKQSIYRFRRADIGTYNEVKRIVQETGGTVVTLSTNFRSVPAVIDWVNENFEETFRAYDRRLSPDYVPFQAGREDEDTAPLAGIGKVVFGTNGRNLDSVIEAESDWIARAIRKEIDTGGASPGDFLIVTRKRKHLSRYAARLEAYGVSHEVTGGQGVNEIAELRSLRSCLAAVLEPDDGLALVAFLRGDLFGFSDPLLFRFKQAGGAFFYHAAIPESLSPEDAERFREAFGRLRKYEAWMSSTPPAAAIERVIEDLGLLVRAALSGGDLQAGSFRKAIEILRSTGSDRLSGVEFLKNLDRLIDREDKVDGFPAVSKNQSAVRIMNLHKAKGLEAPYVFLADPTGHSSKPPRIHVEREGGKSRGYLAIMKATSFGTGSILATPKDWKEKSEEENSFLEAEQTRLDYVAATRAGVGLVVSQLEKSNARNPWKALVPFLASVPELPDPGEQPRPVKSGRSESLNRTDVENAFAGIEERHKAVAESAYEIAAAKAVSLSAERVHAPSSGEHGAEWGSLIHQLIETVSLAPDRDLLLGQAEAAARELEVEPDRASEAIEVVESVQVSEIWRRSMASNQRFVEIPFQLLREQTTDTKPTLVRGVIDLVFSDPEGWVIVDYKTDAVSEATLGGIVDRYRPQVENYRRAWEEITGEPVVEAGLFFTRLGKYVVL